MWKVRVWSVMHTVRLELRRFWHMMAAAGSTNCPGSVLLGEWSSGLAIEVRRGRPDWPFNEKKSRT